MKIKKINDNTLSCIISPEDLQANGFQLDDFFEHKKEAVDFIRSTVTQAAISENFDLTGDLTTMRVSVLPDHSLSLLITKEGSREGAAREIRRIAQNIFESMMEGAKEKNAEDTGAEETDPYAEDPSADLMKALLSKTSDADTASDSADGQVEGASAGDSAADTYMFSFFSVRDAMDCGKVFAQAGPLESSFYYLAEDETYFLIIHRTEKSSPGFEKIVLSANEFGELITSQKQYIAFVTEHGVCIAKEHAIEMFMDVMPGLKVPKIRTKKSGQPAADRAGAVSEKKETEA